MTNPKSSKGPQNQIAKKVPVAPRGLNGQPSQFSRHHKSTGGAPVGKPVARKKGGPKRYARG